MYLTSAILLPLLVSLGTTSYAQPEVKVKVETKAPAKQAPGTVSISAEPATNAKEANPGVEFSKLGGDVAHAPASLAKGGATLLEVSAPLGTNGSESVLVYVYRLNNAVFMDVLTGKGKQAWTRRNSVRLLAPLPDHPENLNVTIRYLDPRTKKGLLIVAVDKDMNYTLAFPKGLGGTVTQQQFLNTSKTGTQATYSFGDLDGRGFAIVKGTVVSSGDIKAGDAQQYFVWNGSRFIPRAKN